MLRWHLFLDWTVFDYSVHQGLMFFTPIYYTNIVYNFSLCLNIPCSACKGYIVKSKNIHRLKKENSGMCLTLSPPFASKFPDWLKYWIYHTNLLILYWNDRRFIVPSKVIFFLYRSPPPPPQEKKKKNTIGLSAPITFKIVNQPEYALYIWKCN